MPGRTKIASHYFKPFLHLGNQHCIIIHCFWLNIFIIFIIDRNIVMSQGCKQQLKAKRTVLPPDHKLGEISSHAKFPSDNVERERLPWCIKEQSGILLRVRLFSSQEEKKHLSRILDICSKQKCEWKWVMCSLLEKTNQRVRTPNWSR